MLHSALPQPLRNAHVTPALSGRGPHMALTMVVLGMIHLAGGAIDESELTPFFNCLCVLLCDV